MSHVFASSVYHKFLKLNVDITMVKRKGKLRAGAGAEAVVLAQFIHPSQFVRAVHKNKDKAWKSEHETEIMLTGAENKTSIETDHHPSNDDAFVIHFNRYHYYHQKTVKLEASWQPHCHSLSCFRTSASLVAEHHDCHCASSSSDVDASSNVACWDPSSEASSFHDVESPLEEKPNSKKTNAS